MNKTALERAFDLARTGEYRRASDIRQQLVKEGYSRTQIDGPTLLKQLNEICAKSQPLI